MFRWDGCGITCVLFVYAAIIYADYVTIYWLIWPTFDGSLWGVLHVVSFNTLLLLVGLSHLRAMTTDPGVVPLPSMNAPTRQRRETGSTADGLDDAVEVDMQSIDGQPTVGADWSVCARCDAYRPPRAHHCRVCGRCIRRMDHHCPWINNCVGEFNQKYFVQFLIWTAFACVYCTAMVATAWAWPCGADKLCIEERNKQPKVLHSIIVTIEAVMFAIFVVAVNCDQLQAILSDETAVEQVQRRGPARPERRSRELMQEICGPGPLICWLLPCHSLPPNKEFVHFPRAATPRAYAV